MYHRARIQRPSNETSLPNPSSSGQRFGEKAWEPGDTSQAEGVLRRFAQRFQTHEWPGGRLPEVYYDPRSLELEAAKRSSLHAKCIVVDRGAAFVTLANFSEAAQTRNIEVGALIRCQRFAARLIEQFNTLVDTEILKFLDLLRPAQP